MSKIAELFNKESKTDESDIPAYQPPQRDTRIKILKSCSGSSDGIKVEYFQANREYMVSKKLASLLVDELKAAERV